MKICRLALATFLIAGLITSGAYAESSKFIKYYNEGVKEFQDGKYRAAIKWFRKAAALEEKNPLPYGGIGQCHFNLKEYKAAVKAFRKAISLERNNARHHAHLAESYAKLKDFGNAVAAYEEALKLNPADIVSRYNLGLILDAAGDSTKAESQFKTILSEIKDVIKNASGKGDNKRAEFLRDIEFETRKSLAVLYHNRGDNDGALVLLDAAMKERSANAEIYYLLGAIKLAKGDAKAAAADLKKSIELDTHRAEVHHMLGNAYVEMNEYDKAIAAFEKAIFESPSFAPAYYNLGEMHRFREEYEKALEMYNRASAINPADPAPWRGIGKIRYERYSFSDAAAAYRQALKLEEGDRETRIELANVLSDMGNYSQALEELKTVKALGGFADLDRLIAVTEGRLEKRKANPVDPGVLKNRRPWSNSWTAKGKGFEVRSNTTPEFCREFLEILERITPYYDSEFDLRGALEEKTTKVYVFATREEFRQYCRKTAPPLEGAAGFFDPGRRLIVTFYKRGILTDKNVEVLQHESLHLATFLAYHRSLPGWLAEGLAEYYEGVRVKSGGKVTKAEPEPKHIETIKKHFAGKKALTARGLLDADTVRFFDSRDSIYYAQSWVLVSLLKEKHASAFDEMLFKIRKGQEPEKAIKRMMEKLFGSDAALENAWKLHFQELAKKTQAKAEKK